MATAITVHDHICIVRRVPQCQRLITISLILQAVPVYATDHTYVGHSDIVMLDSLYFGRQIETLVLRLYFRF